MRGHRGNLLPLLGLNGIQSLYLNCLETGVFTQPLINGCYPKYDRIKHEEQAPTPFSCIILLNPHLS